MPVALPGNATLGRGGGAVDADEPKVVEPLAELSRVPRPQGLNGESQKA